MTTFKAKDEYAKFNMKVNYVKVVDELLRMRQSELVEKVIHRNWRPYYNTEQDKIDFKKEQYDRAFKGDYEKWGV
jgi:hypothetical protein